MKYLRDLFMYKHNQHYNEAVSTLTIDNTARSRQFNSLEQNIYAQSR